MGAIATFDLQAFITRYTEFTTVDPNLLNSYWIEASLYHANDGSGRVQDINQQALLLNMVTAHIAQLNKTVNGQAGSDLVGRIDSASEGSVSVSATMDLPPGSAQWFNQTKYGAAYWQATAGFRTMRYRPGPRRIFSPFYGGRWIG